MNICATNILVIIIEDGIKTRQGVVSIRTYMLLSIKTAACYTCTQ